MNGFTGSGFSEPFERFFEDIMRFLPRVLGLVLIILLGIVFAYLLKIIVQKLSSAAGLDRRAEKYGAREALARTGLREPFSRIFSDLVFWLTVVIFVFLGLHSLEIPAIEQVTSRLILYLPNLLIGAFLLFLGYILGNVLGRTALIAAVNAGIRSSGLIGKGIKWAIFLLALTMALEQLGIGRQTMVMAFTILFGGIILALALAFGLGGRDIAREYLEKKLKPDKEEKDEIEHI